MTCLTCHLVNQLVSLPFLQSIPYVTWQVKSSARRENLIQLEYYYYQMSISYYTSLWNVFKKLITDIIFYRNMLHKDSDEAKRQLTKQGIAVGK